MARLLLERISHLVTLDDSMRQYEGAYLLIEDGVISDLGEMSQVPSFENIDYRVDCSGLVILPGLINTHHHFYQTLTRNLPACQDAKLFDWLTYLYEIWAKLPPEALRIGVLVASAELLSSGCTTAVDHAYVYPSGSGDMFSVEVNALRESQIRSYLCRGSMSLSKDDGGLPPRSVVQKDEEILEHSSRVIDDYHDESDLAMLKVVLAPCSPFSVTPEIMRDTAELAKERSVLIHTHLAETEDENEFCLARSGKRPTAYLDELGWIDSNAFFAHCVWLNEEEISLLAARNAGVAHCPTSNMRLGSGIAPIVPMLDAGVKLSIAVDGSASNDSSNMIAEARQALLLQRVKYGASSLSGSQVLRMATRGGAEVLNRSSLGSLEKGKAADLIGIETDTLEYAGALSDPALAPIFCFTKGVSLSVVNGEVLIERGEFKKLDVEKIIAEHNSLAQKLLDSD